MDEIARLDAKIRELKIKQAEDLILLKEQLKVTRDSLRPSSLVKSAYNELTKAPNIKNNLISIAIGLGTGFVSKKLLIGRTINPLKQLLGLVVQFAVTKLVAKKANKLNIIGDGDDQEIFTSNNGIEHKV